MSDFRSYSTDFVKVKDAGGDRGFTLVEGPCMIPGDNYADRAGDVVDAETVAEAAWEFLAKSRQLGEMHKHAVQSDAAQIVESWLLKCDQRFGDRILPKGTWMAVAKIVAPVLRKKVLNGEYRGFSIGGRGRAIDLEHDE